MLRAMTSVLWLMAAATVLILIAQPIGVQAQFLLSMGCLAVVAVISFLRLGGVFRHILLAFGTIIIMRYVFWRVTETIPSPQQLVDFIPAIILLLAEFYCLTMLALSLFVNANPITRPPAPQVPDSELPTVDVMVPSYNEDPELVAVTLAAARALDYPRDKLTVYLLDDGGTEEKVNSFDAAVAAKASDRRAALQRLCVELGVRYLTRDRNVHAKAGNLNNGLAHSQGDLVVVFDADHVPAPEFLRKTVGHFTTDPKLFLVQTPHFFINADPLERNLDTFRMMPSENEMFYSAIQKGLDSWNSAFFCGSAAVLRREALIEAGGFSGLSITEDCETALDLHSRGWRSLYVDEPMIAGLQPETFDSFIGQRSRWARGMIQIFILKNPLLKAGLSLPQRLCYTSSNIFWFFPISRLIFMISPLLFIFFNLQIYNASPQEFVAYTLTYVTAALMIQNYVFGRLRWPWISELYEYVQSLYLVRAIGSVIANPRAPKFNVTAKGNTLEEDRLSELAWPFYAMFGLQVLAFGYAAHRYVTEVGTQDLLLVVGLWNIFNLVLSMLALGVVAERRERRTVQRIDTSRAAEMVVDDVTIPVAIEDASIGGLRIRPLTATPQSLHRRPATLIVTSPDKTRQSMVSVRLVTASSTPEGPVYGGRFTETTGDRARLVAELGYGNMDGLRTMRAKRQRRRSIALFTLTVMGWSVQQLWRGIIYALLKRGPGRSTNAPAAPATTAIPSNV